MFEYVLTNLEVNPITSLKPADPDYKDNGIFRRFDQRDFLDTTVFSTHGLADYGYIYYPKRCVDGSVENCKVHMSIPGCTQT